MIDLDSKYVEEVKRILVENVPDLEVRAFGSRVNGNAETYSDLDLALVGPEGLEWGRLERLKDVFAESDLPFMVDILDWSILSPEFRQIIEERHEILHKPAAAP